ncbi:MAG TPA: hypothetical protein VMY37_24030 [Thermoguttaceae bacterium]|nr:hypothetical protein [Thermoguttaceae bacterium]
MPRFSAGELTDVLARLVYAPRDFRSAHVVAWLDMFNAQPNPLDGRDSGEHRLAKRVCFPLEVNVRRRVAHAEHGVVADIEKDSFGNIVGALRVTAENERE